MSSKESWAYLNRVVEGPSRPLQKLLAAGRDADEIAAGVRARASWLGELGPATEARHSWDRAAQDIALAADNGIRLITPEDAEWPREQLDLAFGFAASGMSEHLRSHQEDAVAPHALWVRGAPLPALLAQAVAIVGTRTATAYGREATRAIVAGLSSHQWTIVSGGAKGIDAIAHETALAGRGSTIVVAACGLDHVYPAVHADLFQRVVAAGSAMLSEYPPGTTPQRHRFLTRNRLVAALTQGTVLTQAPWRSGALNTMTWAEGLGKVAMAVPGPITTNDHVGCHARIKEGRAELVTCADDVRSLLETVGSVDPNAQYEMSFGPTPVQSLSRNELRVYDGLHISSAREAQDIATEAGLTLALTVHLLVELERRSLVRREGTGWRRREA